MVFDITDYITVDHTLGLESCQDDSFGNYGGVDGKKRKLSCMR